MTLTLIAAVARNGVIGNRGEIPWHIPEDLQRFKAHTLRNPVIMGRETFGSIVKKLGRPLPERYNIVLSSNPSSISGFNGNVVVAENLNSALEMAGEYCRGNRREDIFVCGGERVYGEAMDIASKLVITKVYTDVEGDRFFPEVDNGTWDNVFRSMKMEYGGLGYRFLTYERRD